MVGTDRFKKGALCSTLLFLAGYSATAPAADAPQLATLQADIAAREYTVTIQAQPSCSAEPESAARVPQAPNRAHNLRSCFLADGVHVVPRTGDAGWHWGLRLAAYGDPTRLTTAAATNPSVSGNRVEYARDAIIEWYVNDRQGLEQGFTLTRPLTGADTTVLRIGVLGDLEARLGGNSVEFSWAGRRILDYGKLVARDATGAKLASSLQLVGDDIELRVSTAGARYPVMVDPVTTSGWAVEGNQDGATLGASVATAGDVNGDGYSDVIVGAPNFDNGQTDEGRAFVYLGTPAGPSTTFTWSAESNIANAAFGQSVATAGDVNGDGYSDVIVGAPVGLTIIGDLRGRAHVFLGSATGLSTTAAWTVVSDQDFASFGWSVASAGDVNGDGYSDVIVGALQYDHGQNDEGRAYVYLGSASGLSSSAAWVTESDQPNARYGGSVATAGDADRDGYSDVIVGAPLYDGLGEDSGRAWVYLGSGTGLATTAIWTMSGVNAGDQFGTSVATAGDTDSGGFSDVIIGAPGFDSAPMSNNGIAYVYSGTIIAGTAGHPWIAIGTANGGEFGHAVATAGDVNGDGFADVVIGAPLFDSFGIGGRAYLFLGSLSGPRPDYEWTSSLGQASALYGSSVATAGDVNGDGYSDILVGAPGFDDPLDAEGTARLYLGSADGPALEEDGRTVSIDSLASHQFGYSVASAGDVNGDGYSDLIVGAPRFTDIAVLNFVGAAFVFTGGPYGYSPTPAWSFRSDQPNSQFGAAVASAGDVNGDGYDDVIVGAPFYSHGEGEEGRAYVFYGGASGVSLSPARIYESNQNQANLGSSVSSAGDVNSDGYSDVIVGAPQYTNGEENEGRAFVYLGSPTGPAAIPSWMTESNVVYELLGTTVASAGDVNRDGYSDVVVTARGAPISDHGTVYVYFGGAAGLAPVADWTFTSLRPEGTPQTAASAGDVNGDGYSDVIVGFPYYSGGLFWEGRVAVFHGGPPGSTLGIADYRYSSVAGSRFGSSVASAGDTNGDGLSDVLIGAPGYSLGGLANQGAAYVFSGNSSGVGEDFAWIATGQEAESAFGAAVASAGDINGDGFSDIAVGQPQSAGGVITDAGKAHTYFGNFVTTATSLQFANARQRRAGDTGPLPVLGASGALNGVNLQAFGRSPFGRGDVRMQYEIAALGQPLNGTNLRVTSWTDPGGASAPLAAAISNLAPGTPYHWRLRVQYRANATPFQSHGRWLTLAANAPGETDLRTEQDTDFDTIFDRLDNCKLVANTNQLDSNGDLYGNICDADLNNSGRVTTADYTILRSVLNQSSGSSPTAAAADLNGSGRVTVTDYAILRTKLNLPPGPSGLRPGCPPTCP